MDVILQQFNPVQFGIAGAVIVVVIIFVRHTTKRDEMFADSLKDVHERMDKADVRRDELLERIGDKCHATQNELFSRQELLQRETNAVLRDCAAALHGSEGRSVIQP